MPSWANLLRILAVGTTDISDSITVGNLVKYVGMTDVKLRQLARDYIASPTEELATELLWASKRAGIVQDSDLRLLCQVGFRPAISLVQPEIAPLFSNWIFDYQSQGQLWVRYYNTPICRHLLYLFAISTLITELSALVQRATEDSSAPWNMGLFPHGRSHLTYLLSYLEEAGPDNIPSISGYAGLEGMLNLVDTDLNQPSPADRMAGQLSWGYLVGLYLDVQQLLLKFVASFVTDMIPFINNYVVMTEEYPIEYWQEYYRRPWAFHEAKVIQDRRSSIQHLFRGGSRPQDFRSSGVDQLLYDAYCSSVSQKLVEILRI